MFHSPSKRASVHSLSKRALCFAQQEGIMFHSTSKMTLCFTHTLRGHYVSLTQQDCIMFHSLSKRALCFIHPTRGHVLLSLKGDIFQRRKALFSCNTLASTTVRDNGITLQLLHAVKNCSIRRGCYANKENIVNKKRTLC